MSSELVYDVQDWRRLGRGHVLQFFATDAEVQDWLLTLPPDDLGPYSLVGSDSIRRGTTFVERGFEFQVDEFLKAMYEKEETRWQYWVRSRVLTPTLDFAREKQISKVLALSGLVMLQHGINIKGLGRSNSTIGIVDKIRNDSSGQEVVHRDYRRVFDALKKGIEKKLCYSTMWQSKDGILYEDCKLQLMTEAAVKAHKEGAKFKNLPGKRIRQ